MNVVGDDGICRVYNYAKIGKHYVSLTEGCRFEHLFFRVQDVNGSTLRYESPKAYYKNREDETTPFVEKRNNYNLLSYWKSRRDKVIADFFQQEVPSEIDVSFELKQ